MPRIQHKRGTSANLASVNPTPLAGELVWDSTENAIKIGDGATAWSSLAYVTATPRSHAHDGGEITTGTLAYARLPVGSTSSTVCAGDDARLTDARTPTAHKASHATGGSDALTPADIGAAPAVNPAFTGAATFANTGNVVPLTITNTGNQNCFVVNDVDGDLSPFVIGSGGAVGMGTSSPSTRLEVVGVITVSATSGSAGSYLPSLTFSGDANTGFGQVSGQSDTASIFTAGHERVRVDSSGRVGIGATPATTLHVSSATGRATPTPTEIRIATTSAGSDWSTTDPWGRIGFYSADTSANGPATQASIDAVSNSTAGDTVRLQFKMWDGVGLSTRMEVRHTGAVRFIPRASDPASGEAGDVYYNSSTNKLRVYDGTSWIDLH